MISLWLQMTLSRRQISRFPNPSDPSYNICKFVVYSIITVDLRTWSLQFFKYNKKNNRKPTSRDKNHVQLKNTVHFLKESVSSVKQ